MEKTRKDRLFLVSIYLGTCGDDRHPALAGAYTPLATSEFHIKVSY